MRPVSMGLLSNVSHRAADLAIALATYENHERFAQARCAGFAAVNFCVPEAGICRSADLRCLSKYSSAVINDARALIAAGSGRQVAGGTWPNWHPAEKLVRQF